MRCTICGREAESLCSWPCLRQAREELARNLAELQDPTSVLEGQRRGELIYRNGQLTDALIRWRPDG